MLTEEQKRLVDDKAGALFATLRYSNLNTATQIYDSINEFMNACKSVGIDETTAKTFIDNVEIYIDREKRANDAKYNLLNKFLNQ